MRTLSPEAFARARTFVLDHARLLEQRLFAFHFEGGPSGDVLHALKAYQNEDGGFAYGLEPDLRTASSSVITTSVGLRLLREVGAPPDHPLVRSALHYLLETYDAERQVWPIVPPQVEDAAHAPWWDYAKSAEVFGGFKLNPRAELLGYLYACAEGVPAGLCEALSRAVLAHLESVPDKMDMNDLLCCLRLEASEALPGELRERVRAKLLRAGPCVVERDPEAWSGYTARPLLLVSSPHSLLAGSLRDAVEKNLDYEIEHQGTDGSWGPFWSWFGHYPEQWETAERELRGLLTVETLKVLRAFGRIEGVEAASR